MEVNLNKPKRKMNKLKILILVCMLFIASIVGVIFVSADTSYSLSDSINLISQRNLSIGNSSNKQLTIIVKINDETIKTNYYNYNFGNHNHSNIYLSDYDSKFAYESVSISVNGAAEQNFDLSNSNNKYRINKDSEYIVTANFNTKYTYEYYEIGKSTKLIQNKILVGERDDQKMAAEFINSDVSYLFVSDNTVIDDNINKIKLYFKLAPVTYKYYVDGVLVSTQNTESGKNDSLLVQIYNYKEAECTKSQEDEVIGNEINQYFKTPVYAGYSFTYNYYNGAEYIKDSDLSYKSDSIKSDSAITKGVKTIDEKTYSYVGRTVNNKTVNLYYVCYNDFIDIEKTLSSPVDDNGEYTLNFTVNSKEIPSFNNEGNKILLIIDTSRSMACSVDTGIQDKYMAPTYSNTRWSTLVNTVSDFLDTALSDSDSQVCVVTYAGNANSDYVDFTNDKSQIISNLNTFFNEDMFNIANEHPGCNVDDIKNYVPEYKLESGTNIAAGLNKASTILGDNASSASVILMTDGAANKSLEGNTVNGTKAAADAAEQGNFLAAKGTTIYSIAMVNGNLNSTITVSMGQNTFSSALYQSSSYDILKQYFELIFTSISGLNLETITMTDVVNDNFSVIDSQPGITVNGQTVTIPVSNITTTNAIYSFKIKAASDKTTGTSYTNGDASAEGIGFQLNYITTDGSTLVKLCDDAPVAIIAPKAVNDNYTVRQGQNLVIAAPTSGQTDTRLLANDSTSILDDANTGKITLSAYAQTIEVVGKGTVVIGEDGSFTFTQYANALNNIDTITFNYNLVLSNNGKIYTTFPTVTATVTINIIPMYKLTVNYYDEDKNTIIAATSATIYEDDLNKSVNIDYSKVPSQYEFVKYSINGGSSFSTVQPTNCTLINDITYDIYFQYKSYPVTIEYYKEGTTAAFKTEPLENKKYGTVVENLDVEIANNEPVGYKFDKTENLPLTVGIETNVIKVYYIKDADQTKTLTYTVRYYKDGVEVTEDAVPVTETVWINDADTLTVKSVDTANNKYVGYKFESTDPSTLPATIASNSVIKVNYIKDADQTKTLTYTVRYYKDEVEVTTDAVPVTETVWINDADILTVKSVDTANNKYVGYKFDSTDPSTLPETIASDSVIKVNYIKDADQTKTLTYTVRYYKDEVEVTDDAVPVTETVWINDADTLTVKSVDTANNKYVGYKFDSTDPSTLPTTIASDSVIKVNYIKDADQTKTLNYTVRYYKDGVEVTADAVPVTETVWINDADTLTVQTVDTANNKYLGYKFESTDPSNLPATIASDSVIKVNYIKDANQTKTLTYTVRYYKDEVEVTTDAVPVTETVWINAADTLTVQSVDTANNKYVGYKFESTDPSTLPATIASNSVIKVNYIKDADQTKTLTYTVRYYKDGVEVTEDAVPVTETVWINDADTLTVKPVDTADNKYVGYKFDSTDPSTLPAIIASDSVIKVNYIKDADQTKTLTYTVRYYKDGVEVTADAVPVTETVWINDADTLTVKSVDSADNKYVGYKFDSTDPSTFPETIASDSVIKVNYIKDAEQTKTLTYDVKYFQDGIEVIADAYTVSETVWINAADTLTVKSVDTANNKYVGYSFDAVGTGTIQSEVTTGSTINVYYSINSYAYKVNYYYDNELDPQATVNEVAEFNSTVPYIDKVKNGYALSKVEGAPLKISENIEKNIINVYYEKANYSYSIEYYYDGKIDNTATITATKKFAESVEAFDSKIKVGYKLDKVFGLPLEISTDTTKNVVRVYYEKDSFNYKIEYYYDNVIDKSLTVTGKKTFKDKIENYDLQLKDGYKLDKEIGLPLVISEDEEKNVIKVHYVKDSYNYTVEYYYNNKIDTTKTLTSKAVFGSTVKYTNKPVTGYVFLNDENSTLTISSDETKNVIKVYYILGTYDVTVQYYLDGVINNNLTNIYKAEFGTVINSYNQLGIEDAIFSKVEGLGIKVSEDPTKNIIKVYYISPQIQPNKEPEVAADEETISPQTNDATKFIYILSLLGASGTAFIVVKKKTYRLRK